MKNVKNIPTKQPSRFNKKDVVVFVSSFVILFIVIAIYTEANLIKEPDSSLMISIVSALLSFAVVMPIYNPKFRSNHEHRVHKSITDEPSSTLTNDTITNPSYSSLSSNIYHKH